LVKRWTIDDTGSLIANGTMAISTAGAINAPAIRAYSGAHDIQFIGTLADAVGIVPCKFGNANASTLGVDRYIAGFYNDAETFTVPKSYINSQGEYETLGNGLGALMKSPDGTRYRLSIADGGGAVTITAVP